MNYNFVRTGMHDQVDHSIILFIQQVLNRQVNELRNSLQFSNKSCEQLEQKAEELERNNIRLQKLCDFQESLVAQKSAALADLQKECSQLKNQYEQLQLKLTEERQESDGCEKQNAKELNSDDERNVSETGDSSDLQSTVAELTLKVQNSTFQKQKLERELEDMLNENQSLVKALDRADSEAAELHAKLKAYEENSLEILLLSPNSSRPISGIVPQVPATDDIQSPLNSQPVYTECRSPKKSVSEQMTGLSLFSELEIQNSTLQQRYRELVEECTCSASLFHKKYLPSKTDTPLPSAQENGVMMDTPFKELFDEVFATLKQTTLVADKLIERNNSK